MLSKITGELVKKRRQRRLAQVRRELSRSGYSLDHLDDEILEAAVAGGEGHLNGKIFLTPKKIFFTLRRLAWGRGNKVGKPAQKN